MTTFMFRLHFFVKGGLLLDEESESIEINLPSSSTVFKLAALRGAKSLKEAEWFVVSGKGYESKEEAWREGQRLRDTLQFLAVRMERSIDLGNDKPTSRMSDGLKRKMERVAREHGEEVRCYDNVHGLAVYAEHPRPMVHDAYGQITVHSPSGPGFQELLAEVHAIDLNLDERSSLACSLYGAAQVEESPRVRFLFLVMAIESLLKTRRRIPGAVSLVDRFIESTQQSSLDSAEKDSLLGSLRWLRNESISRMGKQLMQKYVGDQQYGGMKAPGLFRHCYSIRSQLLHNGKPDSEDVHIPSLVHRLDRLVADLLSAICSVSKKEA